MKKNKLISEISEALKTSKDKCVTDTHIVINHNGYEYKVYKSSLKDLQRLAYIENCLEHSMKKKMRIKLVEELKKIQIKTNWLYNSI